MVAVECRVASYLRMDPLRVRRTALPLVLLWMNYAAQVDGMETWWMDTSERRLSEDEVHECIRALREQLREPNGNCTSW